MNVLDYMKDHLLFLDGGMGTLLQAKGLPAGEYPERWNRSHPEIITQIHADYFRAGSHIVSANTFGANSLKFEAEELEDLICAALENAKAARDLVGNTDEKWIALDIGSLGKLLKPYGDLDFEDAVSVFAETVRLGAKYGADLVFIETMNDSYETKAALLAAKENCDLPVFVSNCYGEDGKLMTGASPEAMVALLEGMGADAIGVNCSLGPKELRPIVEKMLAVSGTPVILKPNAGLPTTQNGITKFNISADEFAAEVTEQIKSGVRLAGGCCGTTPEYIQKVTDIASAWAPIPITPKEDTVISSYTHTVTFGTTPVLIGERINPTGKKRLKEALKSHDLDYVLTQGISQKEKGVHVLDVNVGLPEIDEPALLCEAVTKLQSVVDLPLQIDTSDPVAMETALRRYNGKAMINSVNGKAECMKDIFPLAKKYGGVIVALTLDENGIPETAEGRLQIAKRILDTAEKYGISKKDIIFDPLAMTISTNPRAATETLSAVKRIKEELSASTSLGVSNVSFGLPKREAVNSTFFSLALEHGLDAAIMNPFSAEMMNVYFAFCALHGLDENCANYIRYVQSLEEPTADSPKKQADASLRSYIIKGLKNQAGDFTRALLEHTPPMEIVQTEIIPALDEVGKGFEENTVFLPQLLMSAEAAQSAFREIKSRMPASSNTKNDFPIVIATVEGDIHDIGKNIVKLLLENYGFPVTDLGKNVPSNTIVETVVRLHAPLVGLSALMTTTVSSMEDTITALRKEAPWCKIVVGGAVLTPEYAAQIGADHYAKDAMETVRYAEALL